MHLAQSRSRAIYLGSVLFPGDDLVLCLFEADSRAAVKRASDEAGIPCERVMDTLWIPPDGPFRFKPHFETQGEREMNRSTIAVWSTLPAASSQRSRRPPRSRPTLCVGERKPGCSSTVQAAVDAAHDGDTIVIAPGTYAGGVTVDVSVAIVGAGASSTIIKGGGPVLTIGVPHAASQPTVSITGVTITGGVATGRWQLSHSSRWAAASTFPDLRPASAPR